MSKPRQFKLSLTLAQMLALEYIAAHATLGEVPLIHVSAGFNGMQRLRDEIAYARSLPLEDVLAE